MIGFDASERCLIGEISMSMAVTKATKPPTEPPSLPLCHIAIMITADSAQAASTCVIGVCVDAAMVALSESRLRPLLWRSKRPLWTSSAPCSRTMRQASTFSSTTYASLSVASWLSTVMRCSRPLSFFMMTATMGKMIATKSVSFQLSHRR